MFLSVQQLVLLGVLGCVLGEETVVNLDCAVVVTGAMTSPGDWMPADTPAPFLGAVHFLVEARCRADQGEDCEITEVAYPDWLTRAQEELVEPAHSAPDKAATTETPARTPKV